MTRVYEEIIDFIAGGTTASAVVNFQPSAETRKRVANLLHQQRSSGLTEEQTAELEHYLELEHIMRLVKARARQRLGG